MTKAEYQKINTDSRETRVAVGGLYRFRTAFIHSTDGTFSGYWAAVFLTDSKAHPVPTAPETTTVE